MNKGHKVFKIVSIITLGLDLIFSIILITFFVLALTKVSVLNEFHLIIFICSIILNILYISFVIIFLIKNKLTSKKRSLISK